MMLRGRVAVACAAFVIGIGGASAVVATTASSAQASTSEVLAFGNQGIPNHTQFGIFSVGSGNTATGSLSVWQKAFPTPTTGWHWVTANVTCSMISGNDAVLTGTAVVGGATETVVAEAVDNSNPSGPPARDAVRFSYAGTITQVSPGCYTPALAPVRLKNGDVRVGI